MLVCEDKSLNSETIKTYNHIMLKYRLETLFFLKRIERNKIIFSLYDINKKTPLMSCNKTKRLIIKRFRSDQRKTE
jgi:hypothetical protein